MVKKMSLLAAAISALVAFAVPAFASAAPLLTDPAGKAVTFVTITSDPSDPPVIKTPTGKLKCVTTDVDVTISKDIETEAVGTGNGKSSTTGCKVEEAAPATVTNITLSNIVFKSNTTGTMGFSILFDVPAAGLSECKLSGSLGFKYVHKTNTTTITTPNALTGGGGSASCPTTGTIEGSLIFENANEGAISFS